LAEMENTLDIPASDRIGSPASSEHGGN
jgi:hypothetical protein